MLCPCGGKHTHDNKSQHDKTVKHQNYLNNLDVVYNKPSDKHAHLVRSRCQCGGLISKFNKITHENSKQHTEYHKLNPIS